MNRILRSRFAVVSVVVALIGCAIALFWADRPVATADDASHTTTLGTGSYDMGTGGSPESAVIATLVSTSSSDVLGKIYISRRPSGGSSYTVILMNESPTDAGQSGVSMDSAVSYSQFDSGDTVQAQFFTYDSSSNQTFSYTRTISIP